MSDHFPNFSQAFFRQSKVKFRNKRAGKLQQKNQIKVSKHDKRSNLRYHNMSRDESPRQRRKSSSITSRVSLYFLSCSNCFLRALQQNRAQSRLLYNLNKSYPNSPMQFCPFPVYRGWQLHRCDPMVLVQFAFSWQEWFPSFLPFLVNVYEIRDKKNGISKLCKNCRA